MESQRGHLAALESMRAIVRKIRVHLKRAPLTARVQMRHDFMVLTRLSSMQRLQNSTDCELSR